MQWQQNYLTEQINAMPDPVMRGVHDTIMQMIGMATSAYGGGAGYTGTYQPSYEAGDLGGSFGTDWGWAGGAQGPNQGTGE